MISHASTIGEVRAAEARVDQILAKLRDAGTTDSENLSEQLKRATDEYAKAVRELEVG